MRGRGPASAGGREKGTAARAGGRELQGYEGGFPCAAQRTAPLERAGVRTRAGDPLQGFPRQGLTCCCGWREQERVSLGLL